MMVETILESSQDFGMSNGSLPQWKRELLQRRAARTRPAPPPAPQAPTARAELNDDDEELRYGPGIVKRLKSRYLSLALRDAPRRRPSVLRRAASLEHLIDELPPPAPRPPAARAPRPVSLAAPPTLSLRRDSVKRARSVDALSRLEAREEPRAPSLSPLSPDGVALAFPLAPPAAPVSPATPPPPVVQPPLIAPSLPVAPSPPATPSIPIAPPAPATPPPLAPRPPVARTARPPRRPTPLLRETERPPPDVVRSTLRKFESAPNRRAAPAARVSAVLRGLEGPRTSTPEPRSPGAARSPSPAADVSAIDEPEGAALSAEARPVSRAALEGIARAGSSMRFAFSAPRLGSHLPPLAAANPVLLNRARRVGVIRPMPAPTLGRAASSPTPPPLTAEVEEKLAELPRLATPPPAAPTAPDCESALPPRTERREPPPSALVEPIPRSPPEEHPAIETNGVESPHPPSRDAASDPTEARTALAEPEVAKPLVNGHAGGCKPLSRLGGADVERAWNGSAEGAPWPRLAAPRGAPRAPSAATSVVFNFSDRKEVPDYIENDGLILRASRRNRIKGGEAEAGASEAEEERAPSPCGVRFVNDNVLINGRSSMPARPDKRRIAKLKLQFDDSLTRTFEYPSETSLCEDEPVAVAALVANTHIASASLARYTPSKTRAADFQLGVTRAAPPPKDDKDACAEAEGVRACGADARSWSEARAVAADLLF